jgi:hypothetical protein
MFKKFKIKLINNRIQRINKRNLKNNNEYSFPLYFGWEIVLRKVDDLKKHIVGPFKEYWQYMTAVVLLIAVVSTGLILNNYFQTKAATYHFVQSSWIGGQSDDIALHPGDQADWTKYSAKDDNINADENLTIISETLTLTHDTTADFTGGTLQGVLITGDEISLDLP